MKPGPKPKRPSKKRVVKIFSLYRDDLRRLDFIQEYASQLHHKRVTQSDILRDMLRREYHRWLKLGKEQCVNGEDVGE